MTVTILKRKISRAVNEIDDTDFLRALHTIISSKKEKEILHPLSAKQKKELDKRLERHKKGESKTYTWSEVKKAVLKK